MSSSSISATLARARSLRKPSSANFKSDSSGSGESPSPGKPAVNGNRERSTTVSSLSSGSMATTTTTATTTHGITSSAPKVGLRRAVTVTATTTTAPARTGTPVSAAAAARRPSERPRSEVYGRTTSTSPTSTKKDRAESGVDTGAGTRTTLSRVPSMRFSATTPSSNRPATSGSVLTSTNGKDAFTSVVSRPVTSAGVSSSRQRVSSSIGNSTGTTSTASRHIRAKSSIAALSSVTSTATGTITGTATTAATGRPSSQSSNATSRSSVSTNAGSKSGTGSGTGAKTNGSSSSGSALAAKETGKGSSSTSGAGPKKARTIVIAGPSTRVKLPPPPPGAGTDRSKTTMNTLLRRVTAAGLSSSDATVTASTAPAPKSGTTATSATRTRRASLTGPPVAASPAKPATDQQPTLTSKPSLASILAPPTPSKLPANVALSAEVSRLQAELLQLHVLHRAAAPTRKQWEESAREKLRVKWEHVRAQEKEVRDLEAQVEFERGLDDLLRWGYTPGSGARGLEEKVAMLDEVLCGVWGLGERYERVVRGFEKWVGGVEEVRQSQAEFVARFEEVDAELLDADTLLLPELLPAWHAEHSTLSRRLEDYRRKLISLGNVPPPPPDPEHPSDKAGKESEQPPSSLVRILAGCRALVNGMLDELDLMEAMVRDAAEEEMAWVREVNRREDEGEGGARKAGAIWRVL